MNNYAIVTGSGEITQIYRTTSLFVPCGEEVSDTTHYVDTNTWQPVEKGEVSPTVGVLGMTASVEGVPAGMVVEANGSSGTTDGEVLNIHFDVPGTYTITFRGSIEYLDHSLEVTVGDP